MEKFETVIITVAVFGFGFIFGVIAAVNVEHQRAIDAGVGRWEQVDDGPETEFVYGVPETE